jgi:antitoxin component YwqK of YwqJK toxin-antitoxin module
MKRILLLSIMALMTVVSFGRNRQNNETTVVSDTIFYSDNMLSTVQRSEASYYRLLMTEGNGLQKRDIFKDYYLNGQLKAVGGYSFIDLGNDNNTVLNGEVTTYYNNGKERWHGNFNNGKRNGRFTLQMRDGSFASAQFIDGVSKYDYFIVTSPNGDITKHPISELKSLLKI